jgi:hypothetical protein
MKHPGAQLCQEMMQSKGERMKGANENARIGESTLVVGFHEDTVRIEERLEGAVHKHTQENCIASCQRLPPL